jgi:predicted 2-oxoglutarate/Fe(II)-dependent dioxygenase YbiX
MNDNKPPMHEIDVFDNRFCAADPDTEEVAIEYYERIATHIENQTRVDNTIYTQEQVESPNHYNNGKYEVIDVIEDWGLDFHAGNVVKYVSRYQYKGAPLKDLEKAHWYLERLIEMVKERSQCPR